MAVIRVPFCAIAELDPPFMLDEDFSDPNGVKSVMFNTDSLHVAARQETIEVPEVGPVEMCIYHVTGAIQYMCGAYPVVQGGMDDTVQQRMATFSNTPGNTAVDYADTSQSDVLGWVSAKGCAIVDASIGGACTLADIPDIESVTVESFAVASSPASVIHPTFEDAPESCAEEAARIVKWKGCFVISTTD